MTNEQDEINEYIRGHFHEEFLGQEYLSQFNNQRQAEEGFERDFEYRYNSDEGFNLNLNFIRFNCDFLTTINICGFVADAYDEYDMKLKRDKFKNGGDGLLKAYIYFYLRVEFYDYMMSQLIPEGVYEEEEPEEEPENELPPAQ